MKNDNLPKVVIQQGENEKDVNVRFGDLPPVRESVGVSYSGIIKAPADWYTGKVTNELEIKKSDITIVAEPLSIKLICNEFNEEIRYVITGTLEESKDLKAFGINTSRKYTNSELAQLLKMNRYHFKKMDENHLIVKNLNQFKAKVVQEIENANDFKGNKKMLFEQQVDAELKLSFKLDIPLYSGEPKSVFSVDIEFDVTDGGVTYWLSSPELKDLQTKDGNSIIGRELKRFEGLTIIRT